ncbi:MAG TPA: amidohydrolase [Gemmatimonadales bacterium]|jgi:amidohydrolase|nr:amidohydrolase [Gemmatimonadales bacterium]
MRFALVLIVACALPAPAGLAAQASRLDAEVDRRASQVEGKVVAWRRDIHAHPELSNREVRTAQLVADHLRALGLDVRTGVAHTGVVAVLRGGRPGPVVALRADMDALPVTEEVDVPFASKVRTTYNGQEVGVMHACGHDTHVAMLMGVAEVLAGMRRDLPGTVKFIFQPAEEGPPAGEQGGAEMMIAEGALDDPKPDAIFGLHVFPYPAGQLRYRPGGTMAGADGLRIVVRGRQTHGAQPWAGVDPIVVASQIVLGLQTIASRQVDITAAPAIVTIGAIHGGVRNNIIPDSVVMIGTIRSFDPAMQRDIHDRVRRTAEGIAQSAGATALVTIEPGAPVTYNDPALTQRMLPTLREVAGAGQVMLNPPLTTAEDFSRYQQRVPGLFVFLGITPPGADPRTVAANHSPRFFVDEAALPVGVRALAHLAVDYLAAR